MQLVEQAIFASLDGSRASYRIVARSPGVCDADAGELAVWGPAHDSMIEWESSAESLNFHPLPSGAHCISRTTPIGWDCSGGRQRVCTQCLIVPPETLARFGNNPFALARAASAEGAWHVGDLRSETLPTIALNGGAAPVDQQLLSQLAVDPGPKNVAALVQTARDAACLAVGGTPTAVRWMAVLFSCLPPECRLEFSFSTGLKFSPRRPFRLLALPQDPAEQQWIEHYANVAVLKLQRGELPRSVSLDGWSQFVLRALSTGQVPFFAAQASKRRFHLTPSDLPALGLQLLEEMDGSELDEMDAIEDMPDDGRATHARQSHAAHHQFAKSQTATVATPSVARPSTILDSDSPEVLEKLEELDDLVYEALGGNVEAVPLLQAAWPKVLAELGDPLLAESREQYLRYAVSVWEELATAGGVRDPARAIQALDVLSVLFGDSL